LTRVARARPDVPNGKPLGRHVRRRRDERAARSARRDAPAAEHGGAAAPPQQPRRYKVGVRVVAVMSVSSGIVGTVALPSYGVDPDRLHAGGLRAGAERMLEGQSFVGSAGAHPAEAVRHAFSATTMEELEAARERERAAEREFAAAKHRALEAAAAGKLAEAHPAGSVPAPAPPAAEAPEPAPPVDDGSIVSVARRYLGVPYVFGGASPSGFDCSGLVLFVFAQFGISLPHSSLQQGANGVRVADPAPGDLVILDGGNHIGIYTGDGSMIHAPMPGRVVVERPIYTANHYFVRY
jgi:peptidoglycan DL-endopeptidase CwlO